jgi:hypothetical protein
LTQEFTTGAILLVGGLEAAMEVLSGPNIAGVDVVFDCRGDPTIGRHRTVHHLPPTPPGVTMRHIPATSLSGFVMNSRFVEAYTPLAEAIQQGRRILVFCINGKHRSAQTVTMAITPFFTTVSAAMDHVFFLRNIVEFTSLQGPLKCNRYLPPPP